MSIRFRIRTVTSNNGDQISFPSKGVVCVVGGNNVGKSQLLREIRDLVGAPYVEPVVLASLESTKPEITEALSREFLEAVAIREENAPGLPDLYRSIVGAQKLTATDFYNNYRGGGSSKLQNTWPYFIWFASAGSLLDFSSARLGRGSFSNHAHPLDRLFSDGALEAALSELTMANFNEGICLDRISGELQLRVGILTVDVPPINHPTAEYASAVALMPSLSHQGDGLRSFLGVALGIMAGSFQIALIDEPEAFLHPPQARALGRWLAVEAVTRDMQVFVATHDRDLVLGLLDGGHDAVVQIIRVTREGRTNSLRHLSETDVRNTWSDPVLRYSNLLQGLFHRLVVICEGDADCRYYGAVLDNLAVERSQRARADDVLFVPAGGKERVAQMAKSLRGLGVNTAAIVDFDALRSRDLVGNIVRALGHTWTSLMDKKYVEFAASVNQTAQWSVVKVQGTSGVPPGKPNAAASELLVLLSECGMHVVPVGEMESYDRSISLKGAAWVSEVLDQAGHRTTRARSLVERLLPPST